MTYFVTGATGFIGRRLLADLVATRKGPIHVLVRPGSEDKLERFAYQWGRSSRVKIVSGELTERRLGVSDDWIAENTGKIKHVFHLAASYDLTASKRENDALNLDGTRHALELAEAVNAGTFHQVSSIAAAGDFHGRFTEDMFRRGSRLPVGLPPHQVRLREARTRDRDDAVACLPARDRRRRL